MLNTDAIRKRFSEAIIGIRADGSMAVLVKGTAATFFDLVSGENYWQEEMGEFVTLIRPGDRVECKHREDDDTEWQPRTYWGYSGDNWYPFRVKGELKEGFPHIRPLPAPVANPELEQARVRIENAERELSEARAALERAQK